MSSEPTTFSMLAGTRFVPWMARLGPRGAALLVPVMYAIAFTANAIQGTVGPQPQTFSLTSDVRHLLGFSDSVTSTPAVPERRDLLTLSLIVVISLSFVVVCAQARLFARCFDECERNGVLRWRPVALPHRRRLLRPHRLAEPSPPLTGRDQFCASLTKTSDAVRKYEFALIPGAVVSGVAVQFIFFRAPTFIALAPDSLSDAARRAWARSAYENWWASFHHVVGAVAYLILASLSVLIILAQQLMSFAGTAAVLGLGRCAELDIDWLNADGNYGWGTVRQILRLAYMTTALRAVTITILLIGLGIRNPLVIGLVAAVWLAFIIGYLGAQHAILSEGLEAVRDARIAKLVSDYRAEAGENPLESLRTANDYAATIAAVRAADVNPMSLGRWQSSSFVVVVGLPVVLTVVQLAVA